ncbi:ADP-ribosylglycohydrolase family protein [Oricola sp.]|uniref:ADP-ribosylglycohydrolase family protein n=1 Tax=Oricola sp. TaxID=1979950 RepID=UPI003BA95792
MPSTGSVADKIHSGLLVAGIGDALGAPTEQYTMSEIVERFGPGLIERFYTPPPDTFAGANHGKIAEITDDASQMYYLAGALAQHGPAFENKDWIACLLDWHHTSPKAGFMGPSTEAMVSALRKGEDPTRFGLIGASDRKMTNVGATNGAAMRAAPVGMCFSGDIAKTAEYTLKTCLPSHDASVAIEAACSISGGVSAAMVADSPGEVIDGCIQGALEGRKLAAKHARLEAGPRFQARLNRALEIASACEDDTRFLAWLEAEIGNSVFAAESVPCAIAILAYADFDPWHTVRLGASIGNDSDSIATMAGSIAGVFNGCSAIPDAIVREFIAANPEFDLRRLAIDLADAFRARVTA